MVLFKIKANGITLDRVSKYRLWGFMTKYAGCFITLSKNEISNLEELDQLKEIYFDMVGHYPGDDHVILTAV